MTGEDGEQPAPTTDPREIERVAAEINVSPDQIESLKKYPRTDGTFLDDITLRKPDQPGQQPAKPTLGGKLKKALSKLNGEGNENVGIIGSDSSKSGDT